MAKALEVTDSSFEELIQGDKPVLVDFWAEWCGPCKMIGPVVEQLAGEYEGKAVIAKMDVDANAQIPAKFGIRSIPTLMIFQRWSVGRQGRWRSSQIRFGAKIERADRSGSLIEVA